MNDPTYRGWVLLQKAINENKSSWDPIVSWEVLDEGPWKMICIYYDGCEEGVYQFHAVEEYQDGGDKVLDWESEDCEFELINRLMKEF